MPVSFEAIYRPVLCAATAVGMCAVLLGRYGAKPRDGSMSSPPVRSPALPLHGGLSNYPRPDDDHTRWLIDRKTGEFLPCTIPGLNRFDLLGCSPWRDGAGQYHLVMRYKETTGEGTQLQLVDVGLARCTYPERRVFDRVVFNPLPQAGVCWYPDRSDTIIYTASDGRLYRYAFSGGEKSRGSTTGPQPIRWEAAPLGVGEIHFRDLCWPSNPALGGRLLASLSFWDGSSSPYSEFEFWWLQVSHDGQAIISAGRMIDPEAGGAEKSSDDIRLPAVGSTHEGRPLLAYLARVRARSTWDLWVAPIAQGMPAGVPRLQVSAGHKLAEKCVPLQPAFSADERWIYAAVWEGKHNELAVKRFAVVTDDHRNARAQSPPRNGYDVLQGPSHCRAGSE